MQIRKSGTYNLMEPLVRFAVDMIQLLLDVVRLAWVEMGMEQRLYKPSLERCVKRIHRRRKLREKIDNMEVISSNEEPKVKSKKFQKILRRY